MPWRNLSIYQYIIFTINYQQNNTHYTHLRFLSPRCPEPRPTRTTVLSSHGDSSANHSWHSTDHPSSSAKTQTPRYLPARWHIPRQRSTAGIIDTVSSPNILINRASLTFPDTVFPALCFRAYEKFFLCLEIQTGEKCHCIELVCRLYVAVCFRHAMWTA